MEDFEDQIKYIYHCIKYILAENSSPLDPKTIFPTHSKIITHSVQIRMFDYLSPIAVLFYDVTILLSITSFILIFLL